MVAVSSDAKEKLAVEEDRENDGAHCGLHCEDVHFAHGTEGLG